MSDATTHYRLNGLEPDNLLAFLALLGMLRSLEAADQKQPDWLKLCPRAFWDIETAPLRPVLRLTRPAKQDEVTEKANVGIADLAKAYNFDGRKDLNYTRAEARSLLARTAVSTDSVSRNRADLFACLMSDAAIKENKNSDAALVDPTPFCLLFGQGYQHFLERLATVPNESAPRPRGREKKARTISAAECISEALFAPWHRSDPTFSFRWDPDDVVRYALMAGETTDRAYKNGTQHGANRLAAIGLAVLTIVPESRAGRIRSSVLGGTFGSDGFSFRWPIWTIPSTLAGLRSLLAHPDLHKEGALAHLGVAFTLRTRRISVGKFMNFTRARLETTPRDKLQGRQLTSVHTIAPARGSLMSRMR